MEELAFKSVLCQATSVGVKALDIMALVANEHARDQKQEASQTIHMSVLKFKLTSIFTNDDADP
jgi:hypothetical protein